jgi:hypothetical protein
MTFRLASSYSASVSAPERWSASSRSSAETMSSDTPPSLTVADAETEITLRERVGIVDGGVREPRTERIEEDTTMADNAKDAWSEVSDRFTSWGKLVTERYRERKPDAGTGETSEESGRKLDDAARDLSDQLNRAFSALGDTLRDAEAKDRLKEAVKTLGDAVTLTVNETTEEVRKRLRTTGSDTPDDPPTPPSPPPA